MKFLYLIIGARLQILWKLFSRNRISFSPKALFFLLLLLQSALWSSLFAAIEKRRYSARLRSMKLPDDPLFIVGHWRTGTTYLHQLIHLDPQFTCPELVPISIPDSFLVSGKYYRKLFGWIMGGHRPMDRVKIAVDEPQEDEFALFRMTGSSPFERILFPRGEGYFLDHYSFIPENGRDYQRWKGALITFHKKLTLESGKTIVSKNPFHSMRIRELKEIFPRAKFIFINRNPIDVIPSTSHMWNIAAKHNALNNRWTPPSFPDIVRFYKKMIQNIEDELETLPEKDYCVVRFEDLEEEPGETLRSVYQQLNLHLSIDFLKRIEGFTEKNKDYRKNEYNISLDHKKIIEEALRDIMERYRYTGNPQMINIVNY